jgi:hypothetical protein
MFHSGEDTGLDMVIVSIGGSSAYHTSSDVIMNGFPVFPENVHNLNTLYHDKILFLNIADNHQISALLTPLVMRSFITTQLAS